MCSVALIDVITGNRHFGNLSTVGASHETQRDSRRSLFSANGADVLSREVSVDVSSARTTRASG